MHTTVYTVPPTVLPVSPSAPHAEQLMLNQLQQLLAARRQYGDILLGTLAFLQTSCHLQPLERVCLAQDSGILASRAGRKGLAPGRLSAQTMHLPSLGRRTSWFSVAIFRSCAGSYETSHLVSRHLLYCCFRQTSTMLYARFMPSLDIELSGISIRLLPS